MRARRGRLAWVLCVLVFAGCGAPVVARADAGGQATFSAPYAAARFAAADAGGVRMRAAVEGAGGSGTPHGQADPGAAWLERQTRRLVDLIATPKVSTPVLLVALLAATILGMLHALAPGHGKTLVGAYLIGSRGTPRHAVILGLTVTMTHTLVVYLLGLATLVASRFALSERLVPLLGLLSGLLVVGTGLVLLRQRWPTAHEALARWLLRRFEASDGATRATRAKRAYRPLRLPTDAAVFHGMRRPQMIATTAGRSEDRDGGRVGATHSHGGRMHSHVPLAGADERVSWRSLVTLGISGGLVPCPSAMVLLLAAVALDKAWYGLLLVAAFSVGLAAALIAVGLLFLHARTRFGARLKRSAVFDLLPAPSGLFITIVGLLLCYAAVASGALHAQHV